MSIFLKVRKLFNVKLFALFLGLAPCVVCFDIHAMAPNKGLIESSKAITGLQYLGKTSDGRVKFLLDYWVGFSHYQDIWVSPVTSCPDYNSWLRNVKGVLGDLQSLGLADSGLTVENIINSNNQSFLGNGYPSEKWWNVLNKVLRPGQSPLPWPGANGGNQSAYNPGTGVGEIETPNKPVDEEEVIDRPNNGSTEKPDTTTRRDEQVDASDGAGDSSDITGDVEKNNLKKQLRNIAEMYAYSLLGEFVGHVSVGLYEEFTTKDPVKLLNNWNRQTTMITFKVIVDREKYKLYKAITKARNIAMNEILRYNEDNYTSILLTSFMNVYVISLQDLVAKEKKGKVSLAKGKASYVANSVCQWVDKLDIDTANKKLKISRKKSLENFKERVHKIMNTLVRNYTGSKDIRLSYKCKNSTVNGIVKNRINELVRVINTSKNYDKNPISFVSRVSKVVFNSFKKVSIINAATISAKFIVNPAKFIRELKSDKDILSINPKMGIVSAGQGIFHVGSVVGAAGAIGVVAGMTGQLWLVAIPTCANVIIDYMVSKTNAATMMKTFLSKVDESGVYNYEQQKILREFLKIASNKLNTIKNRILSVGIKKEVLSKMVTQLFNLLEGGEVARIDNETWKNFKNTRIGELNQIKKYTPAKILSSYSITNAFIGATPEIYLATKAEVNTGKDYQDKDARAYNQETKVHYLQEFFKIMTDMYHYMRYAKMMDLYYNKNYGKNNESGKTNLLTKIKKVFNNNGNNITKKDVSKFLNSLHKFVINGDENEIKNSMTDNEYKSLEVVFRDRNQKFKEFGEKMFFKNLFNSFSIVYDNIKKNKYQKVMNIMPYVRTSDVEAYTKELHDKIEAKEKNLKIFLMRDAELRLFRVGKKASEKRMIVKTKVVNY